MLINFAFAYLACAFLCTAMNRHATQIFPQWQLPTNTLHLLKSIGWSLMLVTATLCIQQGAGTGLVLFAGLLSGAIFILALLLNYAARWIPAAGLLFIIAGFLY